MDSQGVVPKAVFASLVGSLVFANNAFPGCLSMLNPLFSFLNGHSLLLWGALIGVRDILSVASSVVAALSAFPPCRLQSENGGEWPTLWCDATPVQLGAVVDGVMHAQGIPRSHIFEAEAMGMDLALSLSSHNAFRVATDNQPLFHAVVKGRSPNPVANELIGRILESRLSGSIIVPVWVPTEDNIADVPSRASLSDMSVVYHDFGYRLK
jgi:hypothetical protein